MLGSEPRGRPRASIQCPRCDQVFSVVGSDRATIQAEILARFKAHCRSVHRAGAVVKHFRTVDDGEAMDSSDLVTMGADGRVKRFRALDVQAPPPA